MYTVQKHSDDLTVGDIVDQPYAGGVMKCVTWLWGSKLNQQGEWSTFIQWYGTFRPYGGEWQPYNGTVNFQPEYVRVVAD